MNSGSLHEAIFWELRRGPMRHDERAMADWIVRLCRQELVALRDERAPYGFDGAGERVLALFDIPVGRSREEQEELLAHSTAWIWKD